MGNVKISNYHPKLICDNFDVGSVLKSKLKLYGSKSFPLEKNSTLDCCIENGEVTILTKVEHYLDMKEGKIFYVLRLSLGNYVGWFEICNWTKKIYDFETSMSKKKFVSLNFDKMFTVLQK